MTTLDATGQPAQTAAEEAAEPALGVQEQIPAPLKHPISRRLHADRTAGERLADRIAAKIGSWGFLIVQTVAVALWVALNAVGIVLGWDPYPFALLNLLFSVQAAYTGPILLLSQNRSTQRDRIMAEHDYATNERSERLIEALLGELLRNSQATLAIAGFHGIELEALERQEGELAAKIDAMREQLTAVGESVADRLPDGRPPTGGPTAALRSSGAPRPVASGQSIPDRLAGDWSAREQVALDEIDAIDPAGLCDLTALPEERSPRD